MNDHNLLSEEVTTHGLPSVGCSQNTQTSTKTLSRELFERIPDKRCLAERAVLYVDCSLARGGYLGKQWTSQLLAECEQRHRDFVSIAEARKAFGPEVIPYGLTLPANREVITAIVPSKAVRV